MFPNCYTLFHNSQNIFQTFSTKGATESIFTRFDLENILSRLAFETGTVNNNLIINSKSLQPLILGAVTILRHVARYETPTSAGLRPATLLKKRLWHRCFPMDFAKFLRSPFFYRTPTVAASEVYFSSHLRNIVCETNHEVKTNIFSSFWCWKNLFLM